MTSSVAIITLMMKNGSQQTSNDTDIITANRLHLMFNHKSISNIGPISHSLATKIINKAKITIKHYRTLTYKKNILLCGIVTSVKKCGKETLTVMSNLISWCWIRYINYSLINILTFPLGLLWLKVLFLKLFWCLAFTFNIIIE